MPLENNLGTVLCATNLTTIDNLVRKCGLQARSGSEPDSFEICSGGRSVLVDPAVERQLLAMAFDELKAAQKDGQLPPFSFLAVRAARPGLQA